MSKLDDIFHETIDVQERAMFKQQTIDLMLEILRKHRTELTIPVYEALGEEIKAL